MYMWYATVNVYCIYMHVHIHCLQQLSLLSGDNDGRDRVPVRIVWRSDDGMVVHNIDTRDGATINGINSK